MACLDVPKMTAEGLKSKALSGGGVAKYGKGLALALANQYVEKVSAGK